MQELRINSQGMSFNLRIKDNKPYYYITIKYPDANVGINQDDNGRPHIVLYFKQFARKKYFGLQEQIKSYANREIYTKYIDPELKESDTVLDYAITVVYSSVQGRRYESKNKITKVLYGTVEYKVVFTFEDDFDVTATRLIDVKKCFTRAMKNYLDSLKPLSKKQYKIYSDLTLRRDYKRTKNLNQKDFGSFLPF